MSSSKKTELGTPLRERTGLQPESSELYLSHYGGNFYAEQICEQKALWSLSTLAEHENTWASVSKAQLQSHFAQAACVSFRFVSFIEPTTEAKCVKHSWPVPFLSARTLLPISRVTSILTTYFVVLCLFICFLAFPNRPENF